MTIFEFLFLIFLMLLPQISAILIPMKIQDGTFERLVELWNRIKSHLP